MGWASGVALFDQTVRLYDKHHPKVSEAKKDEFLIGLVNIFEEADWDTIDDSQYIGRIEAAYKRAGKRL